MKKYILYPGEGKESPLGKTRYIDGRNLAACYKVPYSECQDMSNAGVRKIIDFATSKGAPCTLLRLLPMEDGIYKLPSKDLNKIIIAEGFCEQVNNEG